MLRWVIPGVAPAKQGSKALQADVRNPGLRGMWKVLWDQQGGHELSL